jgi:hypothetical protein
VRSLGIAQFFPLLAELLLGSWYFCTQMESVGELLSELEKAIGTWEIFPMKSLRLKYLSCLNKSAIADVSLTEARRKLGERSRIGVGRESRLTFHAVEDQVDRGEVLMDAQDLREARRSKLNTALADANLALLYPFGEHFSFSLLPRLELGEKRVVLRRLDGYDT